MGGQVGCVLNVCEASASAVKDVVSRLAVSRIFIRGGASAKALKAKAPVCSADGRAPGLMLADDDAPLRAALDAVRAAGADPYVVLGNPFAGRAEWKEFLAQDNGSRSATAVDAERPALCPNHPRLVKWAPAAAAELVRTYKPAGVLLEDFSVGSPDKVDSLFLCWCERCQGRAVELGYDADRIRVAMQSIRTKLTEAGPAAGVGGFGLVQVIEAVGYDTGFLDWFNLRADCVSACLYEVRQAVAAADTAVRVGVMTKAPTVALLAAQRRADLTRNTTLCDFYAPLVCGPGARVLETIAWHSVAIRRTLGVKDEAHALALSARLHGYSHVSMPATSGELVVACPPELIAASGEHETGLALSAGGPVPCWPAIDVTGQPAAAVGAVAAHVRSSAAEGLVYVGVPR